MRRHGPLLGVLLTLGACAVQPPDWMDTISPGPPSDAARVLENLYEFARRMRDLDSPARVEAYRQLDHNLSDCRDPEPCLQLALLISGLEPGLTNRDRARTLLEQAREAEPGETLTAYIDEQLADLARQRRQIAALNDLERRLQQEAQTHAQSTQRLQDQARSLEDEADRLRLRIKTLETKIEALTSIEQSLKNRGQGE